MPFNNIPPTIVLGSSAAGIPANMYGTGDVPKLISGEIANLAAASNTFFKFDLGPDWAYYTKLAILVYIGGGDTATASPANAVSIGLDDSNVPYNRALAYNSAVVASLGSQAVPSYNVTLFAVIGRYVEFFIQNASATLPYASNSYVKLFMSN